MLKDEVEKKSLKKKLESIQLTRKIRDLDYEIGITP